MMDVFAFGVLGALTALFLGVGYEMWKQRSYFFGTVLGLLGVVVFVLSLTAWLQTG